MSEPRSKLITLGRVSGVYGVRGWVKVRSYTEPRERILDYSPWSVCRAGEWAIVKLAEGRIHGKGLAVRLEDCEDREAAAAYVGAEIAVPQGELAALEPGEYYWNDLIGLRVLTVQGVDLGRVDHLLETGANDVLVVRGERERLIPYLPDDVILGVDLGAGEMRVDWDPEF